MSVETVRTFLETISDIRTSQVLDFLGSVITSLFEILLITVFKVFIVSAFKIFTIKLLTFFAVDAKLFSIISKPNIGEKLAHSDYVSSPSDYYDSYGGTGWYRGRYGDIGGYKDSYGGTEGYSDSYPEYPSDEYQDPYTGKYGDDKAYKNPDNKKWEKNALNDILAQDQDYKDEFINGVRQRWNKFKYKA